MNSSNMQRPVVQRARQPEAVVDERQLARAVAVEHSADLRQRDVRLVDDHEEILGEVVEQAGGPLAGLASGEVARVVLDARARADLEHHLDVEIGARLEALRLEQLPRVAQLRQPLGKLGADQLDRALDRGTRRDEVLRRIDRGFLSCSDDLAGERIDLARSARPRRPTSRCARPALRTPERSRRCRRARGTSPRSNITSLREYWIFDQRAQDLVARECAVLSSSVTICSR